MENQTIQKKLPKLTKKQRGFVKDYVLEENGTQAALKNYDTKDYKTASVIAAENLDKPSIIEAIEVKRKSLKEALYEEGIDEKYLSEKVNVLLKAVDDKGQADYTAIDKGLKHALNIHGVEDPDKPKNNATYNFIFNNETQETIKVLNETIKQKLLGNV